MDNPRTEEILRFIRERGSVSVKDIGEAFDLNEATVRRDLRELQLRNLVSRAYGIASALESQPGQRGPRQDYASLKGAEKGIVDEALSRVRTGQMIILPGSPLNLLIAAALTTMSHLSVVTNSLEIFDVLRTNKDLRLILTGGIYDQLGDGLNGSIAETMLQNLRADLLFLEPSGIDLSEGFTHENLAEIPTLNAMIRAARQVILVATSRAFERQAGGIVAPFNVAHRIVTDRSLSPEEARVLQDAGLEGLPDR